MGVDGKYDRWESFEGYQYTHALVAGFSHTGAMLWNHALELHPKTKPKSVEKFIAINHNTKENIQLAFKNNDQLTTLSISPNGIIDKQNSSEFRGINNPEDNINMYFYEVSYWYNNYFMIYGGQKIKGKNKREVFFLNKEVY